MKPEEWDAVLAEGERLRDGWANFGRPSVDWINYRKWAINNINDLLSAARREQRMREALTIADRAIGGLLGEHEPPPMTLGECRDKIRAALAAEKGEQT